MLRLQPKQWASDEGRCAKKVQHCFQSTERWEDNAFCGGSHPWRYNRNQDKSRHSHRNHNCVRMDVTIGCACAPRQAPNKAERFLETYGFFVLEPHPQIKKQYGPSRAKDRNFEKICFFTFSEVYKLGCGRGGLVQRTLSCFFTLLGFLTIQFEVQFRIHLNVTKVIIDSK